MSTPIRLVQLKEGERRRVALSSGSGVAPGALRLIDGFQRVYEMARAAISSGQSLAELAHEHLSSETADFEAAMREGRILPPLDHPDPARCVVSLTGLTHLGSAQSRDQMHAAAFAETASDSLKMFRIGVEGGRPAPGEIGAQPEWAYKGDGSCVVPPEQPLTQPAYAGDGGEEAEIAGLYMIGEDGTPWRVGYALGNEFADHVTEKQNYLYLAHSKLRECSFGPELLLGELPETVSGTVRILRNDEVVWSSPFESGEANMCHSLANLEHHHFKYAAFRRPGDVHVHFFGANGVSFGEGFRTEAGDVFEIDVPLFGRPLRNPLRVETGEPLIHVRAL